MTTTSTLEVQAGEAHLVARGEVRGLQSLRTGEVTEAMRVQQAPHSGQVAVLNIPQHPRHIQLLLLLLLLTLLPQQLL
jgi:hypothetical protein